MCDHVCVRVSMGWEGRREFGCFRQMFVNICKWERVWCDWRGRCVHICVCVCVCAYQCTGDHALLTVSPLCLSLLVGELGVVSTHLPVCFKGLMRSCVQRLSRVSGTQWGSASTCYYYCRCGLHMRINIRMCEWVCGCEGVEVPRSQVRDSWRRKTEDRGMGDPRPR